MNNGKIYNVLIDKHQFTYYRGMYSYNVHRSSLLANSLLITANVSSTYMYQFTTRQDDTTNGEVTVYPC